MKRILGLATASGVAIALMACGGKSKGIEYEDSSFGVSVKLPGGWKQVSKETENDLTTVDFEKGDLSVSLMYSEIPGMEESGLTGEDFIDMMMEEMSGSSFDVTSEGSVYVDGVAGYQKTIQGTIEGSNGVARMIAVMGYDKMTLIIFARDEVKSFSLTDRDDMDEFLRGVDFQ